MLGNTLYVIAGSINTGPSQDIWRSTDPGSTWSQVTNVANFGRIASHTSVVVGNRIYVIGGEQVSGFVNSVWRSAATVDGTGWAQVATTGTRFSVRQYHSTVVLNGAIYVIGGFDGSDNLDDVWKSTDQGVTWVNVHKN